MRTRQGIVSVLLGYCGGAMLGISHSVPLTQAGLRLSAGWNRNSRDCLFHQCLTPALEIGQLLGEAESKFIPSFQNVTGQKKC